MKATTRTIEFYGEKSDLRVWIDADGRVYAPDADGKLPAQGGGLFIGKIAKRSTEPVYKWVAFPGEDGLSIRAETMRGAIGFLIHDATYRVRSIYDEWIKFAIPASDRADEAHPLPFEASDRHETLDERMARTDALRYGGPSSDTREDEGRVEAEAAGESMIAPEPEQPATRKLGDLSALELVESAYDECSGLNDLVKRIGSKLDADERLYLGAYLGSIWNRVGIARDRLRDEYRAPTVGDVVRVVPVGAEREPERWWNAKLLAFTPDGQYRVRSTRPDAMTTQTVSTIRGIA